MPAPTRRHLNMTLLTNINSRKFRVLISLTRHHRVLQFRPIDLTKTSFRLLNRAMNTRSMHRPMTRHLCINTLIKNSIIGKSTMRRTHRMLIRIDSKTRHLSRHIVTQRINRSTRLSLQMIKTRRQLMTLSKRRHKTGLTTLNVTIKSILRIQISKARPSNNNRNLLRHNISSPIVKIRHVSRTLSSLLRLIHLTVSRRHNRRSINTLITSKSSHRVLRHKHVNHMQAQFYFLNQLRTRIIRRRNLRLLKTLRISTTPNRLPNNLLHITDISNRPITRLNRTRRIRTNASLLRTRRRIKRQRLSKLRRPRLLTFISLHNRRINRNTGRNRVGRVLTLINQVSITTRIRLPLHSIVNVIRLRLRRVKYHLFRQVNVVIQLSRMSNRFHVRPQLNRIRSRQHRSIQLLLMPIRSCPINIPIGRPLRHKASTNSRTNFRRNHLTTSLRRRRTTSQIPKFK